MTARIRPRTENDLPACAAALREVHAKDGYPVEGVDDALGWLTPPGLTAAWVAELDGKAVGHVLVSEPHDEAAVMLWKEKSDQPVYVLARLFVTPAARGHRLGGKLTEAAMQWAQERGHRLVLDVMEKDQKAIRLYENLDWARLAAIQHDVAGTSIPAQAYVSPST
ncbi:N-acetyltransferase family protein [Nocardiopsis sp. NPDC055551]